MIGLIADYKDARDRDFHQAFAASGGDLMQAVAAVKAHLQREGYQVQTIIHVPGEHTVEELTRIAERPGGRTGAQVFVFAPLTM